MTLASYTRRERTVHMRYFLARHGGLPLLSKALLISKSTQAVNFLASIPLRNASVV